jgi:hypothetical protein
MKLVASLPPIILRLGTRRNDRAVGQDPRFQILDLFSQ